MTRAHEIVLIVAVVLLCLYAIPDITAWINGLPPVTR